MASKKELAERISKLEEALSIDVAKLERQEKDITDLKRYISDIWRVIKLTNENVDGLIQAKRKPKAKPGTQP